jgi:dienelactone hydrolase
MGEGPTQRPAVSARTEQEVPEDGYTRRLVSYDTEPDERGWAWLLTPDPTDTPRPAVLCLHGTTADAKDACLGLGAHPGGSADVAVHLARRGFVTLAPDHFCAGQRLQPGFGPYDPTPFYARHPDWSEMGKNLYDSQQALDLLAGLPQVDACRLGCIGHSLGGYGTLFLAAVDERVQAAVCSCGITSWRVDPQRENWSRTAPGHYRHFPRLRQYFAPGAELPLDIPDLMACVAPRALLNLSAVGNDSCFPIFEPFAEIYVQVERVYKLLKAEGRFGCYLHSEGHSFNASPRALAYAWLQERLGLPVELGGRQ